MRYLSEFDVSECGDHSLDAGADRRSWLDNSGVRPICWKEAAAEESKQLFLAKGSSFGEFDRKSKTNSSLSGVLVLEGSGSRGQFGEMIERDFVSPKFSLPQEKGKGARLYFGCPSAGSDAS